ncbi:Peptidoglycan/LPS O-acetylase OafA/YrhL, contains acyltransferase and SGNH-hydrolase domains [Micromonospora echinaurantiaca]|uniref:Peptidoglycan/LPS O-acetylase OafA/YrhL, contains acyltransferase and SGNH-hydrolase domains n=1 Tax=Micromonospora echinaurantiaca TaxID=47857 RepID=A0A1C5IXH3_9ACTN|nr:acyltransferase family protein [Micromonospora echinaurantiaca]SCG63014.1 Peptidoglycan/LPS O-acetylase OafA/YrhL, contains acyltransferase and SGNH-hydrolase domains [Micromonospora echinaurantiaca]
MQVGKSRSASFRADIEGMRGLAVTMVVLYHAGVPGFDGGFVGVDVFFVISGFLITGLLTRELAETGRISFANFYARRVRRLLPAAILVAVATFVLARLAMPPLSLIDLRRDAFATLTYVSNYWFAIRNTDYLQDHVGASPFQQYWSLAVEEQFYLLWPAMLVIAALLLRRAASPRTAVRIAVGGVLVISLGLCVVITVVAQPWAFFGLPTRAWELAAGGLVALTVSKAPAGARLVQVLGIAGLVTILIGSFVLGDHAGFPGWIATLPVAGTVLLLISGSMGRGPVQVVLSCRPLTIIGVLSYSIYLWHWPLLLLTGAGRGGSLGWLAKLGMLSVTAVAAYLTFRFVEQPLRHHAWLSARHRRTVGAAGAATLVAAGCAVVLAIPPVLHLDRPAQVLAAAEVQAHTAPEHWTRYVPANLTPPLGEARDDFPAVFHDGCHSEFRDVEVHRCEYGKTDSERTIVLFGDSHAAQWFPPLRTIAEAQGIRLVSLTKSGCPTAEVSKYSSFLGREYWECATWRRKALERIVAEQPDLLLVANGTNATGRDRVPDDEWWEGMEGMFDRLRAVSNVTVLADTPYARGDVPVCLSDRLTDAMACAVRRASGINVGFTRSEAELVRRNGGRYLDLNDHLCGPEVCPAILGNILVYIDRHHLSQQVASWLRAPLEQHVTAAIERADRR